MVARVLVAVMVAGLGYGAWLDLRVRSQFESKRWAVPARLYSRALEVYPGAELSADGVEDELRAAGYRPARDLSRPGSYRRRGSRIEVATRAFRFWDGEEPARRLVVDFSGGRVNALRDSGRALAVTRLEPAVIGRIYPLHHEDRILVRLEDVPPLLLRALVAVEDRTFFQHHGLSARGIARALVANIRAGAMVQGASTITQQLAKNLFLSHERSLWRKLNEAAMALLLEARYTKEAILEAYVNEVFLGQHGRRAIHGFGLAARYYFGRPVGELDVRELTLLVALVRGASYYDPRRHPERAKKRRNLVLDLLADRGLVSDATARRTKRTGLGVSARPSPASSPYPAFVDLVRRQLRRDYREADLRAAGLRIFTTLDRRTQRAAEDALRTELRSLEAKGRGRAGLQGAVTVTSVPHGEVLALVGDRRPRHAGFNRALDATRPIGSLVKPAVYVAALEQPRRYSLASALEDTPVRVSGRRGEVWTPKNYDGRVHGRVALYTALAHSYNLATVRLGMGLGLDRVAATLRRIGVARPVEAYPSMLLGAFELSPLEVTGMYQTLASGGFRTPLRAIREVTTARGRPLARYGLDIVQAVDPDANYLLVQGLKAVLRHGTARGAYRRLPPALQLAGKTGTTDGLRDSWFAGFGGDRLAVVWLGRDDNRPAGLTGAGGALKVWSALMLRLGPAPLDSPPPAHLEWRWTDLERVLITDRSCPGTVRLPFIKGSRPPSGTCRARAAAALPERRSGSAARDPGRAGPARDSRLQGQATG